jgi:hypothetical protein
MHFAKGPGIDLLDVDDIGAVSCPTEIGPPLACVGLPGSHHKVAKKICNEEKGRDIEKIFYYKFADR